MTKKLMEIFKPGRFTDMSGRTINFTEADLIATAKAYDPAIHEAPLVIGHPGHDAPAYGWVKGLTFAEQLLLSDNDQVDADFAELVNSGKFKHKSASFYLPDAPNNPVPGVYYLRHVGFLGAQPPAVKGLKAASFADNEQGVVEFTEAAKYGLSPFSRFMQAFKNALTTAESEASFMEGMSEVATKKEKEVKSVSVKNRASFCTDCSDNCCIACCPEGAISMTPAKGAVIDPVKCICCMKCCDTCQMMCGPVAGMQVANYTETVKNKDRQIATITGERDTIATELAAIKGKTRRAECAAFCDTLPTKISPAMRPTVIEMMLKLDSAPPLEFGEGDAKTTKSALEVYQAELQAAPDVVAFSERATKEKVGEGSRTKVDAAEFGENVDQDRLGLHNKVLEFMETNPDKSYEQALVIVQKQD